LLAGVFIIIFLKVYRYKNIIEKILCCDLPVTLSL